MTIKIINRDTNELVSKYKDAVSILTDDLFSFTVIDCNGSSHWYNKVQYDFEIIE